MVHAKYFINREQGRAKASRTVRDAALSRPSAQNDNKDLSRRATLFPKAAWNNYNKGRVGCNGAANANRDFGDVPLRRRRADGDAAGAGAPPQRGSATTTSTLCK